jgi:hypothetical protein
VEGGGTQSMELRCLNVFGPTGSKFVEGIDAGPVASRRSSGMSSDSPGWWRLASPHIQERRQSMRLALFAFERAQGARRTAQVLLEHRRYELQFREQSGTYCSCVLLGP